MKPSKAEQLRDAYKLQIDVFFNISLKNRYVYIQTPKVASTTIKFRLNTLESEGARIDAKSLPLHPSILEAIHVKPFQLSDDMLSEIMGGPDYFKFCFVRDPFVRVLSCYLDKIKGKKREATGVYKDMNLSLEDDEMTFEQFVNFLYMRRERVAMWNPHWRPLHLILRPDLIRYDLIGKLERFDEDFATLNDRLGGRLADDLTRTPHKTDSARKTDEFYTPEIRSKIEKIYAPDFEHFGY